MLYHVGGKVQALLEDLKKALYLLQARENDTSSQNRPWAAFTASSLPAEGYFLISVLTGCRS